jgi:hypothetical protein
MGKKEDDAAYYARNKERIKARTAEYYARTKAERLAKQKERYERKKDVVLARNKAWADANRDKMREYHSAYVKRNRELWTAQTALYRAAKKQATPVWADAAAIKAFYAQARAMKDETGKEYHVDHIVPLQSELVCGLHVEHNLQVLPGRANRRKSNKFWPDMS